MLEASDYDSTAHIYPFLGAMSDIFCGKLDSPVIMEVFTRYVGLIRFVNQENQPFGWTKLKLAEPQPKIVNIKQVDQNVFGKY